MENYCLHIKNVVCHRCILTIKNILEKLKISYHEVGLGEVILQKKPEKADISRLAEEFEKVGFEIVTSKEDKIINKIKSVIIDEVYSEDPSSKKLSEILTQQIPYDYSHLTHIFTVHEGQSIRKYYNSVRIERLKELIINAELTFSEIADILGYSTPAYLSTSFKNVTGFTPSEYRQRAEKNRINLDAV